MAYPAIYNRTKPSALNRNQAQSSAIKRNQAYPALHNRTKPSAPPVAKPAPLTWSAHTLTLWSGPSCARSGGLQRRDGRSGSTVGASHTYKSPRRVPDGERPSVRIRGHSSSNETTIKRNQTAINVPVRMRPAISRQSSAINVPVRMRPAIRRQSYGNQAQSAYR